ncbi:uncharacterized protein LOC131076582 isoform X2 [Cryptomeria japonica]|uniref:uncharacterized protein LOC131076582 isoform X2 n=1 Tax=Cryptomeria japonica TaxID=3369 RepID=UPI0027DA7C86|nr:uncharacterized protein LOC131076582 isoform X2 [Cryptomeria japonica]
MAELQSRGTALKPRWEEHHPESSTTKASFYRQSNVNLSADLAPQSSSFGGFLVSIPNYSSTVIPPSSSCANGLVGQPPYITVGNNNNSGIHFSSSYKQGGSSNIPTEQEPNRNGVNGHEVNVGQVLAELERERLKNAELLGRVSSLEAQLQAKEKASAILSDQDDSPGIMQNDIKKLKRTRNEEEAGEGEDTDNKKTANNALHIKHEGARAAIRLTAQQDTIVNWMGQEEIQTPDSDKFQDGASEEEYDESDDSDVDSDNAYDADEVDEYEHTKIKDSARNIIGRQKEDEGTEIRGLEIVSNVLDDGKSSGVKIKEEQDEAHLLAITDCHMKDVGDETKVKRMKKKKDRKKKSCEKSFYGEKYPYYEMGPSKSPGVILSYKKPPKTAFCPREVRRIMESGVLALKNAQSHTMRKIIVFASLGIRHGCEDMYELDFNHFTILREGEAYVSPKDPGEHVLYEQPGVRRKIFYPNRQNLILCPVTILQEEKAMRPSDPSCPSCLFLCIKYGGRTRNLPQNEYVRQRMGRNKLKSFGPLICQMAMLVHIRTGSFFFKALGITLLFMAGFTDDVVRRETKYGNLGLLQKYYRSDEDSQGEELFHPYSMFYPLAMTTAASVSARAVSAAGKSSRKRSHALILSKPPVSHMAQYFPSVSENSMASAQFSPMTFHHTLTASGATLPLTSPLIQAASASTTTGIITTIAAGTGPLSSMPRPFSMFPPYVTQRPSGSYLPMPAWHHANSYLPNHYRSSPFGYHAFQPSSHYLSHPSQPYYSRHIIPSSASNANTGMGKKSDDLDELESDTESSSSEADEKSNISNSFGTKDL